MKDKITFEKLDPTGIVIEKVEVKLHGHNRFMIYVDGKAKGYLSISYDGKMDLREVNFV